MRDDEGNEQECIIEPNQTMSKISLDRRKEWAKKMQEARKQKKIEREEQ